MTEEMNFGYPKKAPDNDWELIPQQPVAQRKSMRWQIIVLLLAIVVVPVVLLIAMSGSNFQDGPVPAAPLVIAMQDVPLESAYQQFGDQLLHSLNEATVLCDTTPVDDVKTPAFIADEQVWGSIRVEKPRATILPIVTSSTPKNPSEDGPLEYTFALDHSEDSDDALDLLYIDTNGDQDLSDEQPLKLLDTPPELIRKQLGFEFAYETVQLKIGSGSDSYTVELIPCANMLGRVDDDPLLLIAFLPSTIQVGQTELGGTSYQLATFGSRTVGPPDSRWTGVLIQPTHRSILNSRSRCEVMTHRWVPIGESYASFKLSGDGSRLTFSPYGGTLGLFQIIGTEESRLMIEDLAFDSASESDWNSDSDDLGIEMDRRFLAQLGGDGVRLPTGDYELTSFSGRINGKRFRVYPRIDPNDPQGKQGKVKKNSDLEAEASDDSDEASGDETPDEKLKEAETPDEKLKEAETPGKKASTDEDDSPDRNGIQLAIRDDQPCEFDLFDNVGLAIRLANGNSNRLGRIEADDTVQINVALMIGPNHELEMDVANLGEPEITIRDSNGSPVMLDQQESG